MSCNRRTFLKGVGSGVGLSLLGGALTSSEAAASGLRFRSAPDRPPNIVLCMADDQGWGDVGYNGHPVLQTPNLDEMAEEGVRFDRFYAAAPVCTPTRGSIMTGRHPNRYGCFKWGHHIHPEEIALPELLKTAGYVTGHFGKWHLGPTRLGTPTNPGATGFDTWVSAPNFFDNDPILSHNGEARQMHGESSLVTAHAAIDFIREQADSSEPFLAVVWFGSPHSPHRAAKEFWDMYEDQPENLRDFYGEITAMDHAIGRVRNELDELGIRDNTVFWYCSDNGGLPELGSTGGRAHKGEIYEGGLRVPAILEWPSEIPEPAVIDQPCVTSDMYTTLLDIAGVDIPQDRPIDGKNLHGLVTKGREPKEERSIGFWEHPQRGMGVAADELMKELLEAQKRGSQTGAVANLHLDHWQRDKTYPQGTYPGHAAWLEWPWKLHRIEPEGDNGSVRYELYNLEEDPDETSDKKDVHPERVQSMAKAMEEWQFSVVESLNGADYS